jgi:phosphatidylglycerol:prolipoprotein diacylglycerol transferase
MIDEHLIPYPEWGVKPVLFNFLGFSVPSYSFFVFLGLLAGLLVYWLEAKKQKQLSEKTFYIFLGAIIGGVLGAKLLIMLIYFKLIFLQQNWQVLLYGKSIVGGIIGGFLGVIITKKLLKITGKRGNLFAPAIALGVAIGRIGCFLRGCCYGKATSLPWGVDFGDHILRHPTQIYESLFMFLLFCYLMWKRTKNPKPGQLFKILGISYFTFRFLIEFLRVEPIAVLGMTWFQLISIICLVYLIFFFDKKK